MMFSCLRRMSNWVWVFKIWKVYAYFHKQNARWRGRGWFCGFCVELAILQMKIGDLYSQR